MKLSDDELKRYLKRIEQIIESKKKTALYSVYPRMNEESEIITVLCREVLAARKLRDTMSMRSVHENLEAVEAYDKAREGEPDEL